MRSNAFCHNMHSRKFVPSCGKMLGRSTHALAAHVHTCAVRAQSTRAEIYARTRAPACARVAHRGPCHHIGTHSSAQSSQLRRGEAVASTRMYCCSERSSFTYAKAAASSAGAARTGRAGSCEHVVAPLQGATSTQDEHAPSHRGAIAQEAPARLYCTKM